MLGNLGVGRVLLLLEKSKEGSRSDFRRFNFCECRAVGHFHRDPFMLVHVHKQVVINFVTAESTTKIMKISTPRKLFAIRYPCDLIAYRIEGNFYMVQTFADNLTTAKIKTVKSFNSTSTMLGFVANIRTVKVSSGASGGIFAKVCTCRNFPLYGY